LQVKQREAAFAAGGEKEAAKAVSRSCDDYLRQMGYREYSRYLSFHFPFTHERSLLEHLRACPWKWNQSHFKVSPQPT
jgi:deoxyribodipyrimidine photolyase